MTSPITFRSESKAVKTVNGSYHKENKGSSLIQYSHVASNTYITNRFGPNLYYCLSTDKPFVKKLSRPAVGRVCY